MRTNFIRLFGAALFVSATACGGTPEDYEGADNTDPRSTQANACSRLANCCLSLVDDQQTGCLATANGGEESECTTALQGVGFCQ